MFRVDLYKKSLDNYRKALQVPGIESKTRMSVEAFLRETEELLAREVYSDGEASASGNSGTQNTTTCTINRPLRHFCASRCEKTPRSSQTLHQELRGIALRMLPVRRTTTHITQLEPREIEELQLSCGLNFWMIMKHRRVGDRGYLAALVSACICGHNSTLVCDDQRIEEFLDLHTFLLQFYPEIQTIAFP